MGAFQFIRRQNDLKANSTMRLTFLEMDRDPAQPDVKGALLRDSGAGTLTVGDAATWPIAKFETDLQAVTPFDKPPPWEFPVWRVF